MADYRNSVGYLQLKAANAARQQAIADATTNQIGEERDVGGKALGVMQDMVGDARKQRDQRFERDTRLDAARISQDAILNRLMLRPTLPPSVKDQSTIDLNRARIGDIEADNARADRGLDLKGFTADQKAIFDAVRLAIEAKKAAAAIVAAGAQDIVGTGIGQLPVTPAAGAAQAITRPPQGSPAASGPAPTASQNLPSTTPAAQPLAPDAAQKAPAAVINPSPPPPDTSMYGPAVSKVVADNLAKEQTTLQSLGPELAALVKTIDEGTLDEDYTGGSVGSTIREGAQALMPSAAKFVGNTAAALGLRDTATVDRQNKAQSAYGNFQTKYIKSLSGLTVTDAERTNINNILGTLQDSLFAGRKESIVANLKALALAREQIYNRNNEILKTRHLPKNFAEVPLGEGWGFKEESQGAPQQAAPQQARGPSPATSKNPPLDNPDDFFDWLVNSGIEEKTAMERTKKQFGIK